MINFSNAKFLLLPDIHGYCGSGVEDFIKDKDYVFLKMKNPNIRYIGYSANEHHYTTKFHREVIIPALSYLLNFEFDPNNYYLINKTAKRNDKEFDLSYFAPKDPNYKFEVKGLDYEVEYACDFNGLLGNDEYEDLLKKKLKTGIVTEYHNLYAFPHSCSIVKNLYKHNNRTIFISGDSQAIPFIPVLCTIFKEVWYFDNRSDMSFKDLIGNKDFTDVLIETHTSDITYYTQNNLR